VLRNTTDDTIAQLATAPGAGALAVVRLSGAEAREIAGRIFEGRRDLTSLAGFEGAQGWIRGDEGPVDEVVAWVYRAPRSFTGEDMVELSCHGGAIPAQRVLETVWQAGARPAEPGEFTRRAFLSGRIDLTQAEAVADLIAARGRRAQEQALAQLEGGLSRRVRAIADQLREVLARIEGHLDFGDDVPEMPSGDTLDAVLAGAQADLAHLASSFAPSRRVREGMMVALTGRPNVGKSSLLNALSGHDRAIVHPTPGTTRDLVDVTVEWAGIPIRLVDTAGLREQAGPVEAIGIERTRSEISRADLVLWVVDASGLPGSEDRALADSLDFGRVHLVMNKMDLVEGATSSEWVNGHSPRLIHETSALTGEGIAHLQQSLEAELTAEVVGALEKEDIWVTNERQAHELATAVSAVGRAREVLEASQPIELGAADLHRALEALAAITGDRAGDDLLDEIFTRFCIGK
jgi:tRNA modification GTPase